MINKKNNLLQKNIDNYLKKNIKKNSKILISVSCGLDSTVLYRLILSSKYILKKNIFCIIFNHQKRVEGKYEIKNFIKKYKISSPNLFIKNVKTKSKSAFQEQSRLDRHKQIKIIAKKEKINDIFLGHHLDDLNETFFLRKIQQSNLSGLSNIFKKNINGLNFHRPLEIHTKKEILNYANINLITWYEDRTNYELDYTRNKIRYFLNRKSLSKVISRDRSSLKSLNFIKKLHLQYFKKIENNKFEINLAKFNILNKSIKTHLIQCFYENNSNSINKGIRSTNIANLIKTIDNYDTLNREISIFRGKLSIIDKKIYINLN